MVARVLGKLLHTVGILPTDKVTEVQRTDLVGEFVGHTGPKTRRKVTKHCSKLESPCELESQKDLFNSLDRSKKLREESSLWTKHTG